MIINTNKNMTVGLTGFKTLVFDEIWFLHIWKKMRYVFSPKKAKTRLHLSTCGFLFANKATCQLTELLSHCYQVPISET